VELPGKLRRLREGMEENRAITLGLIGDLPAEAFPRQPEGGWSIAQLLEHLVLAGADPRSLEYPHPFFGVLNLYEWLHRIVLEHERQHHPQIRGIVRALGGR